AFRGLEHPTNKSEPPANSARMEGHRRSRTRHRRADHDGLVRSPRTRIGSSGHRRSTRAGLAKARLRGRGRVREGTPSGAAFGVRVAQRLTSRLQRTNAAIDAFAAAGHTVAALRTQHFGSD